MNDRLKRTVVQIISILLVFLFVYAAVSKLLDVEKFRVQVGQSPLLTSMAGFVAWFIPAVELLVALLLMWPRYQHIGLIGSFGLMVMFTAYIIAILGFAETVPCACGGVLEILGWKNHLLFNTFFVGLAALGFSLERNLRQQQRIE